ncbi:hypothetical protein AXF42_Ash011349 [Apostasia shenzhenica]|uniref:Uncharacterized protein n=1 Tax=Apostasia shenzhenica TaxID=1088818 RepID=A0A2I0AE89_9ASPA|nr:hypothetical protein AXF42_Ash011349 [Apostasia shenzhenica]
MYTMVHHHPLNLGFIIFSWIRSKYVPLHSDRVFMPYCHFITTYLESLRIDISKGAIKKLGKSAKAGRDNMIQVGLNVNVSPLAWGDGKGPKGAPQDELEADAEESDIDKPGPSHAPHHHQPTYSHSDTLTAIHELQSQFGEFRVEVRALYGDQTDGRHAEDDRSLFTAVWMASISGLSPTKAPLFSPRSTIRS